MMIFHPQYGMVRYGDTASIAPTPAQDTALATPVSLMMSLAIPVGIGIGIWYFFSQGSR